MDIILLSGNPNSGKTTTINLVYDMLINKGASVVLPKAPLGGNPNDFECVLRYKRKQVAVYSEGDYLYGCWHAIIKYAYCDKLILAYNSQFKSGMDMVVSGCSNHTVVLKTKGNPTVINKNDASIVFSHV